MRNKNFFLVFLIFTHELSLTLQKCEDVIIRKGEYNFNIFKNGDHATSPAPNNNQINFAFDYIYINKLIFHSNIHSKLFEISKSLKYLEKLKLNPDFVSYIIEKFINKFSSKDNKAEFIANEQNTNLDIFGFSSQDLKEYLKIKEDANSISSMAKKEAIHSGIGALVSSLPALKTIVFSLLEHNSLATSISSASFVTPQAIIIFFVVASCGGLFSSLYNSYYYDGEINKLETEMYKFMKLSETIKNLIYRTEWIENNIVLTAYSKDRECAGKAAQFDYCPDVKYIRNNVSIYYEVIKDMANLTCTLRRNKCENHDNCLDNLMEYVSCRSKVRKGKVKSCQEFTEDCKLKKMKDYEIYEL